MMNTKTLAALLIAFGTSWAAKAQEIKGYGVLVKVIDGDTFIVSANDQRHAQSLRELGVKKESYGDASQFKIRLANVDTPESVHPDKSRNTVEGAEAKTLVKRFVEHHPVHFRCFDVGKYGRAICNLSVKKPDGWFDVGHSIISAGLSEYVVRYGKNPYLHREYMGAAAR